MHFDALLYGGGDGGNKLIVSEINEDGMMTASDKLDRVVPREIGVAVAAGDAANSAPVPIGAIVADSPGSID